MRDRMKGQYQRLRDLMSEVQDNHTDIQRLWKSIEAGGIVWPVGIAAAPPIEEMSSSSSQSSSSASSSTSSSSSACVIPGTLTATVSGLASPWDVMNGTLSITYGSFFGNMKWFSSPQSVDITAPAPPYFGVGHVHTYWYTWALSNPPTIGEDARFEVVIQNDSGTLFFVNSGAEEAPFTECDPVYWTVSGSGITIEVTE